MKPSAVALLATVTLTAGCSADTPEELPPSTATSGGEQAAALQRSQLEAARRHPIATPEPRTLYPEKTPPPREEGTEAAPGPSPTAVTASPLAKAEAPAAETRVVATRQPPAPYQEDRPPAPAPRYVWAPGYWYWYGGSYVWIHGRWLAPRHGYSYVGARWVYSDGGWLFVPGGWALGFSSTVTYPVYPHRHLYHHHHNHRSSHWGGHRRYPPNYGRGGNRSFRGSSRSHGGHRSGGLRRTTARPRR